MVSKLQTRNQNTHPGSSVREGEIEIGSDHQGLHTKHPDLQEKKPFTPEKVLFFA